LCFPGWDSYVKIGYKKTLWNRRHAQGALEKETTSAATLGSYKKHFWIRRSFFWWFLKPFGLCLTFLYLKQIGFCSEKFFSGFCFLYCWGVVPSQKVPTSREVTLTPQISTGM
jgi:hypothetical protein